MRYQTASATILFRLHPPPHSRAMDSRDARNGRHAIKRLNDGCSRLHSARIFHHSKLRYAQLVRQGNKTLCPHRNGARRVRLIEAVMATRANQDDEETAGARELRDKREAESARRTAAILRTGLESSGKTQSGLADALFLHKSQITLMLQGKRSLSLAEFELAQEYLGMTTPCPRTIPIIDVIFDQGHWREERLSGLETRGQTVFWANSGDADAAYLLRSFIGPFHADDIILCSSTADLTKPQIGDMHVRKITRADGLYQLCLRQFFEKKEFISKDSIRDERGKRAVRLGTLKRELAWVELESPARISGDNDEESVAAIVGLIRAFPQKSP